MHVLPPEEPELGDAFGAALRQCYDTGQRAGAAFEVIERSDDLISIGDAVKYFGDFEDWPDYEQEALADAVPRRYHEQNRQHGRTSSQARIRVRHDRSATPCFDYLFCSAAELCSHPTPAVSTISRALK